MFRSGLSLAKATSSSPPSMVSRLGKFSLSAARGPQHLSSSLFSFPIQRSCSSRMLTSAPRDSTSLLHCGSFSKPFNPLFSKTSSFLSVSFVPQTFGSHLKRNFAEEPAVKPLEELEKETGQVREKKPRRIHGQKRLRMPDEAWAVIKNIRVSHKKLNLALKPIRGLSYEEAFRQLSFSPKRIARTVILRALQSCRYNAENVHGLHSERCIVSEAWVGRHAILKRIRYHAKGRSGRMYHRYSRLTIILKEIPYVQGERKLGKFGRRHPPDYEQRLEAILKPSLPQAEQKS